MWHMNDYRKQMQDLIFKLSVDLIMQSEIDGHTIIQKFCGAIGYNVEKKRWKEPNVKEKI